MSAKCPKSEFVKWCREQAGLNIEQTARYLGFSKQYMNNKIFRGSFSAEELLTMLFVAGYRIELHDEKRIRPCVIFDADSFYENHPDIGERVKKVEGEMLEAKHREYLELKKKLEAYEKGLERIRF